MASKDVPPRARPPRAPGRPRDPEIDARVLDATIRILRSEGYAQLTIEHVAREAQVARPTVYRRWPSKSHLVLDAVAHALGGVRPGSPSGDTKRDLLTGVATLGRAFEGILGDAIGALVAELAANPELARGFLDEVFLPRRESMAQVLREGIARGEVRADIDLELVLDALAAPLYYRAIFRHAPASSSTAKKTVDLVWESIVRRPKARS